MQLYAKQQYPSSIAQLIAQLAANTEADIAQWPGYGIKHWFGQGAFVDIGPTVAKLKYTLNDFYYMPDTIIQSGKHIGMPWQFAAGYWGYYPDLFDRYGVPHPKEGWSWQDVVDTAKKLTHPGERVFGLSNIASGGWLHLHNLWDGATLINADATKSTLDTPKMLECLEFFAGLIHREHVIPTVDEAKVPNTRYAIQYSINVVPWAHYQKTLKEQGVEFNVAPLPAWKPTGRKVVQAGDTPNLVQRSATRNNRLTEAVEFLFYMQGDYAGRVLIDENAPGVPTKKSVVNGPSFLQKKPPQNVERALESFQSQNMKIYYPLFPKTLQWIKSITPPWSKVISGEISVRTYTQMADEAANAALSAPYAV